MGGGACDLAFPKHVIQPDEAPILPLQPLNNPPRHGALLLHVARAGDEDAQRVHRLPWIVGAQLFAIANFGLVKCERASQLDAAFPHALDFESHEHRAQCGSVVSTPNSIAEMSQRNSIHRIVLTGGPCAGKTTALCHISDRLRSLGFRVYLVPEAATLLINGGVVFEGCAAERQFLLQSGLMGMQMALEDAFAAIAAEDPTPAVLICDRGLMDSLAYIPPDGWQALLDERGWTITGLRDRRYEAVIHIVTAAEGAEAFYTTANNPARHATPEQARVIDAKLRDAWTGHPHLCVIDNRGGFDEKIRRVLSAICQIVGVPAPLEIERKFLVRRAPEAAKMPVRSEEVEIDQTYLLASEGSEARVRRRGQDGSYTYTHTLKTPRAPGERVEIEHQISPREYLAFLEERDPSRRTIRKRRRCFLWNNEYFELDFYLEPLPGLIVLEAELEHRDQTLTLPPFLEIEREVTGDPQFSNHGIAAR